MPWISLSGVGTCCCCRTGEQVLESVGDCSWRKAEEGDRCTADGEGGTEDGTDAESR